MTTQQDNPVVTAPPDPAARLAGGPAGIAAVHRMLAVALAATSSGDRARGGPGPSGGPETVDAAMTAVLSTGLPRHGVGADAALSQICAAFAAGSVNPAHPLCAAHLHAPPLAVAAAADIAAGLLNASMDSWDQAPSASTLERLVTAALAGLVYPRTRAPDALITTGGTESNLVALLLGRERAGARLQLICGANAHHSLPRAAWMLGLPPAVIVPTGSDGLLRPEHVARAVAATGGPMVVAATAGTTDHGGLDPVPELAAVAAEHGAFFHVDAAYGGGLLFSDQRRHLLAGLDRADTVALDMHKFGWQPLAAGILAVRDAAWLTPLSITADYLNADDDVEAGLPPLLGRSIRTSRRADALKLAVTFHALGRTGLGALVDRCCDLATAFAAAVDGRPTFRLHRTPTLSTVVFRPAAADRLDPATGNALVAEVRRRLLHEGTAVIGRATVPGPAPGAPEDCWLKVTLLNPEAGAADLEALLDLVEHATDRAAADLGDRHPAKEA